MIETSAPQNGVDDEIPMRLRLDVFAWCTEGIASDTEKARAAGISRSTLVRYRNRERCPHPKTARRMARRLGLTVSDLWEQVGG